MNRPLRIFLICQQAQHRHAVPAYQFWENYFKSALAEAGHTWLEAPEVDWAKGLTSLDPDNRRAWLDLSWSRTIETLRLIHTAEPIDFVLSYLFPSQVEPSAIRTIKALGIPCVNFFCDNIREFTTIPNVYFDFDLHWVPEFEALKLYRQAGLKFINLPMPAWVPPVYRTPPEETSMHVTFLGSHDLLREALLSQVAPALPLRLYGAGWISPPQSSDFSVPRKNPSGMTTRLYNQLVFLRTQGPRAWLGKLSQKFYRPPNRDWLRTTMQAPVDDNGYFQASRESFVTLGINRYPSFRHSLKHPHTYSRLRDIEAPMLGACYLTEAAPGLDQLYDLGSEIETYRDADELIAKARALLADKPRRLKMRLNAQRRALHEHSITHSITQIASTLGIGTRAQSSNRT